MDAGVGRLEKKLQSKGILDNTMFVFLIDNGWCNGLVSKGSPFEKGVRTPIFFTWPAKIKAGQRFDQLTSTLDTYPTILSYAGVDTPSDAAGNNLRPVIEGRADNNQERLFGAIYPAFVTKNDERPERDVYAIYVRDRRWKYILYLQDVVQERNGKYFRIQSIVTDYPNRKRLDQDLFDLQADPHELNSLASDESRQDLITNMKAAALAWWKETGGTPLNIRP